MTTKALLTAPHEPEDLVIKTEEYAYGHIIEALTHGLYPDKLHVIREYVQNAYDAVLAARLRAPEAYRGRVRIKTATPSVFIYDDGIGMDRSKIDQYRYVGYSEKRTGEGVGFRGIGKLAGLSVAEKLIVTSSPQGVSERYQLVFDANAMLEHLVTLKSEGHNIPLNRLIGTHTSVTVAPERPETHYTMVELHCVRDDSLQLLEEESLQVYLSMNAPVDFDPLSKYGSQVDKWLREHVRDYDTVDLRLNGKRVFKPILEDLAPPQLEFIWPSPDEAEGMDDEECEESRPLAFCWYCEHAKKGQLPDKLRRGLFYRLKNFAIGDNQLTRTTLWHSAPERAFYFSGEIHVMDPEVLPSSSRDEFEQNAARERLYECGALLSKTLNRIAGRSSDERRAVHYIERAEDVVSDIFEELQTGGVPEELVFDKKFAVRTAAQDVQKRLRKAPEEMEDRGQQVIEAAGEMIRRLDSRSEETETYVYDIRESLDLGPEASHIYTIVIECLRKELATDTAMYERLVRAIHAALSNQGEGSSQ
jgi:molecular chaperone HtpG